MESEQLCFLKLLFTWILRNVPRFMSFYKLSLFTLMEDLSLGSTSVWVKGEKRVYSEIIPRNKEAFVGSGGAGWRQIVFLGYRKPT